MAKPEPRAAVMEIAAYVAGKAGLPGIERPIRLASNESALGAGPKAREAFAAAMGGLHRYPDPECSDLRAALGTRFGLNAEYILCGTGSESLIDLLVRAYAGPGDEVLFPAVSFPLYRIVALGAGARPVEAAAPGFRADVDTLLAAVTPRTKVVLIANPNNPTGTWIPASEVARLRDSLPPHVLLVHDAAYAEYVSDTDYSACAEMVGGAGENTVMTRTFSKFYGLANLRVGWAYCPPGVADAVKRIKPVFAISTPALAAAEAALSDTDHCEKVAAHSALWLPKVEGALREAGYGVVPGAGNFTFFQVPETMGGWQALDAFLKTKGIIGRPVPPANAMRVTIGEGGENEAFIAAAREFSVSRTS